MPDPASSTETPSLRKLRRGILGYRRADVDTAFVDMEQQLVELREQLMERSETCDELDGEVIRLRREIRYWEDRQAFIDTEMERARNTAERVEREARNRAESVEQDAKERSLKMIDRVCAEANAIVQHARDEAREMATRFQDDVVLAEQRIARLRVIETDLRKSVRAAIDSFESGVRTLEEAAPSSHAVEEPHPARTLPVPDFGKSRAVEAARRWTENSGVLPGLERDAETPRTSTELVVPAQSDDTAVLLKPVVR